ncbi:50S ribosomal protein L17 [Caldithrix abyssi]
MRHRKKGNHLGRTASHKKALMRNLAAEVFEHKEIRTTLAKAKELRSYVERLITYGKKGTLHHRRLAFQFLQNKNAVKTLFDEIAPLYGDRAGGYTRIIKLGNRRGDNAQISIFQLVGFEKVKSKKDEKKKEAKKTKPEVKEEDVKAAVEEKKQPVEGEAKETAEPTEQIKPDTPEEVKSEETPQEAAEEKKAPEDEKKE